MAEEKAVKETKAKKLADPVAATIDPASQQMIERAHELESRPHLTGRLQ